MRSCQQKADLPLVQNPDTYRMFLMLLTPSPNTLISTSPFPCILCIWLSTNLINSFSHLLRFEETYFFPVMCLVAPESKYHTLEIWYFFACHRKIICFRLILLHRFITLWKITFIPTASTSGSIPLCFMPFP